MFKTNRLLAILALVFFVVSCGGGGGGTGGSSDGTGGGTTLDIGKVEPLDASKITTDPSTGQEIVNDQILVTFKEGVSENTVNAKIATINGEIVGYIKGMNDYQVRIKGNPTLDYLKALIDQLNNDPDVEGATLNTVVTHDQSLRISKVPDSGKDPKWFDGLLNFDNWGEDDPGGRNWRIEAIKAPSAWEYNREMSSVKIGIVDAGFQLDHEDLNIPGSNAQNRAEGGSMEVHDHGTHVAGVIGAESNDNDGITGILWKREMFVFNPTTILIQLRASFSYFYVKYKQHNYVFESNSLIL